jgi:hypothetical protein
MEIEALKTNLLSIAVAGLLIMLAGVFLYLFRNSITSNVRFFLQIPPLGVAAYIFVFNMFRYYDGGLPEKTSVTIREIIYSTLISASVFFIFTLLLVVIVGYIESRQ